MKAILVIDMPKCCEDCQLINSHYDNEYGWQTYCGADYHRIKEKNKKDFCPLKPMPLKMKADYDNIATCEVTEKVVAIGWNACISTILGEEQ